MNTTDPDSKPIPVGFGYVQGYNAQAAVSEEQIVLAAETTNTSTDFSQLDPMAPRPWPSSSARVWTSYPRRWSPTPATGTKSTSTRSSNRHVPVLVAPDKGSRGTPRSTWTGGRYSWMRSVLASEHGQSRYRKRKQTVEPLFGHTKHTSASSTATD